MTEMEIKQVHVISSSEGEKKRGNGGGREERKPWLQGKDGSKMQTRVRNNGKDWKNGHRD